YSLRGALSLRTPRILSETGSPRLLSETGQPKTLVINKSARTHLLGVIFLFFVLIALKIYFIRIPYLLYSTTGPLIGASYTDIHAILPFLKVLFVIALVVAVLSIINIFKPTNKWIVAGVGLYIVVSILGGWAYPTLLQRLVVLPNELVKETPYLKHHITATQQAFGLDNVLERD
ncbi:unnamed protein product, partial [marine sediment metagenome]